VENIKFAWWPTRVTSGRLIWLTRYWHHRSLYDKNTGRPPLNNLYFQWTETAQERTWRVLKETAVQNRNVWNDYNYTKEDKL
jgi:hypothetical protein